MQIPHKKLLLYIKSLITAQYRFHNYWTFRLHVSLVKNFILFIIFYHVKLKGSKKVGNGVLNVTLGKNPAQACPITISEWDKGMIII